VSIFLVFNTQGSQATVRNTCDSFATAQSVSKAADNVVAAVKQNTEKSTQKVADTVQKSAERVVEAVGKVKIANVAYNRQAVPVVAQMVYQGWTSVAQSTAQIAEYLRTYPAELGAAAESAKGINEQFADMIDDTSSLAKDYERLRSTVAEMKKTESGLVGSVATATNVLPSVITYGRVFNSFHEVYRSVH